MPRARSKESRFEALQKEAVEKALLEAAQVLLKEKDDNNGKIPYGAYNRVIKDFGCPSLTRHVLRHKITELEKERADRTNSEPIQTTDVAATSIGVPRTCRPDDDDVSELTNPSTLASPLTTTTGCNSHLTTSTGSDRKKGGRPKKRDCPASFDSDSIKRLKKKGTTRASILFAQALKKHQNKPPRRTLDRIIEKVHGEFGLPDDVSLCNKDTVYRRVKSGNLTGESTAHTTPMVFVEELLVEFCLGNNQ